ncbi:DoxX family protein [Microbacterium sp.]|uniref:DoxX family protein n=1 Tax=Microbacterium sp. TaxID=51671 RepID=UPI003A948914
MDVNLGLLILRLVLAALLWGHATQKLFGWFRGQGVRNTSAQFEQWGLRPGFPFVVLSGASELVAGALLLLGAFTPLATAIVVGSMSVAIAFNLPHGLWAHLGGYEVALVYALLGVVIGIAGPGDWSVDAALGLDGLRGPLWTLGAIVVGLAGAAAPISFRNITVARARQGPAA